MKLLKNILTPPIFEDELKTQQAYLLHVIVWTLICVPIPFVIYSLFRTPENISRTLIQTVFGETVNIVLLIMLQRGFVQAASIIQVGAFWLFFTTTALTGSGTHSEAYLLGYGLVITIAGILLGGGGAFAFTCISLIAGGLMVYLETLGDIKFKLENSSLTVWVVSLVLFPVGAVLQYLAAYTVRASLARVRASEEKYRLISSVGSDYTFSTELDVAGTMRLNWVAGAFESITGYTFDEYVAYGGWLAHLHPGSIEKDAQDMESLKKNQHVVTEVQTYKKNRELHWVQVSARPVWDDKQNRLIGILGAVKDITERKQAEETLTYERDLLQIFMDNIPDSVYFKDSESRFIRVNKAQAQFLGLNDPQDAIGKTDLDFQSTELGQSFMDEEQRVIASGQPVINRVEFNPTEAGKPRWLSATKVPVKDPAGNSIGIIGVSRDITEQKLAEESEQRRREVLTKILRLGQYVTEVQDVPITLQRIWHSVRHQLNFDRLGIYLYDAGTNSMNGTYGTDNQGKMVDEWASHISLNDNTAETLSFKTALQDPNGLYLTHDYETEHATSLDRASMSGVKDFGAVAAWAGEKPVAVICVDNLITGRSITEEQLEALRLFAGYAGLAIENARLHSALAAELEQQKQAEEREAHRRIMLEKVVKLGQHVTEVADLRTTLARIWHGIHDDLGFDRLGIFLYNAERKSMDDTFGTNNKGEMIDEWDIWFPVTEAATFMRVLERPDGLYFTHNYDVENNIPEESEMFGVKDYGAVAAWAGDKPMAVICVDNLITGRSITEEQLEALRLFAGYAGLAIENARLHSALQNELSQQKQMENQEMRRREMLEKVVQLGKLVTEVSDLKTTLERIWHGVHDVLGFDRLAIFLYDQESHSINGTLGTDNNGNIVEEWEYSRPIATDKPTSFSRALEQPDGVYYTDNFGIEFNIPDGHEMREVKDFAAVTAWGGEKPVAIITVDNFPSKQKFSPDQLEALRLFAGYAGLAIENSRLNTAIQTELTHRQTLIDELENKNAELERFTYTVSHDLKSPLVTITGFLGFLEKDALAGNAEKVSGGIKRITNAALKMQTLLNDLLELSRIGRIMNTPEDVLFVEIVHEAVDRVHGRLDEINALLEFQKDMPIVHGDRVRLVEVVQNLLENAAKYSSPSKKPRIEIGVCETARHKTTFFVRDNGIGIAPEYHENIFGLFNKLDATAEGTGIGLTLVKRIVEVHGGEIWVESESGLGATFYFTLPTKRPTKE